MTIVRAFSGSMTALLCRVSCTLGFAVESRTLPGRLVALPALPASLPGPAPLAGGGGHER